MGDSKVKINSKFQATHNLSSYPPEVSFESGPLWGSVQSVVGHIFKVSKTGIPLNIYSAKESEMNISNVQDNGSAKYFDSFQQVKNRLNNMTCQELDDLIQVAEYVTNDNDPDEAIETTDNQDWMPERLNPFTLKSIPWPRTWIELGMVSGEKLAHSSFIGDTIANTRVDVCPQWFTELATVKNYWQSGTFVDEYHGYLKEAMNKALDEFEVPDDDHLQRYSKLVDNIEESDGIRQSVREILAENFRAVELMELMEIA